MSTETDLESIYAQFSIDYVDNQLLNDTSVNDVQELNMASAPCLQDTSLYLLENPKFIGFFYDGQTEYWPIYHIGFKNNESVFRVSGECASYAEGSTVGKLVIHQPTLFPTLLLEPCGAYQLDVTIRT